MQEAHDGHRNDVDVDKGERERRQHLVRLFDPLGQMVGFDRRQPAAYPRRGQHQEQGDDHHRGEWIVAQHARGVSAQDIPRIRQCCFRRPDKVCEPRMRRSDEAPYDAQKNQGQNNITRCLMHRLRACPRSTMRSLRLRLLFGAVLGVSVALAIAGILLVVIFGEHVQRRYVKELEDHLLQLAAVIQLGATGNLTLKHDLSDPAFQPPLSGLYWQISDADRVLLRSRSLWDGHLSVPSATTSPGRLRMERIAGPSKQDLMLLEHTVLLEERPLHLVVAGDRKSSTRLARISPGSSHGRSPCSRDSFLELRGFRWGPVSHRSKAAPGCRSARVQQCCPTVAAQPEGLQSPIAEANLLRGKRMVLLRGLQPPKLPRSPG